MKLLTSQSSWGHPQSKSALALGLIWALRGLLYRLREEEEAKNFLCTVQPSSLGLKEGPRTLPSSTPLRRVERD